MLMDGKQVYFRPFGFPDEIPLSKKQTAEIIEKWGRTENYVHLAVILREGEKVVGHASAYWGWDPHCPGVDLVISPAHQRQGLGSETLSLLVQWLFDSMPAHNIGIEVADWNEPAQKFLRKLGFQESGRSRREGMRGGKFYDLVLYDILRREWRGIGKS
jgi:RimJ/RimL family protein N-acetyltransferase